MLRTIVQYSKLCVCLVCLSINVFVNPERHEKNPEKVIDICHDMIFDFKNFFSECKITGKTILKLLYVKRSKPQFKI